MAQRVFVGLSGGVDSGTSAALLKERGYDVTGVFIKIWQPAFIECTWREDRLDAMRIAAALDIPFREINLSGAYQKEVVEPMIADYAGGVTPNPDVLCNEKIKFGAFAQWAFAEGAHLIATGHYAHAQEGKLLRGADKAKDQSYFLYRVKGADIARTIFPVGDMQKSEVRAHAERFGLPVAQKPDSQGLCFVGDIAMHDFLGRFMPLARGAVLGSDGRKIGEHDGAALYTIGARHGFTVEGTYAQEGAHYVIATSVKDNTITVSPHRADAQRFSAILKDVHWINEKPALPLQTNIQTRYREAPLAARLSETSSGLTCTFGEPHIISPGQSIVFYEGDVVLGGGIIDVFDSPPIHAPRQ